MKFGVNQNTLLVTAGTIWILAGINIFKIGITTWYQETDFGIINILLSLLVFIVFFCFIFRQQLQRHTLRINNKKKEKNCPFSFFDLKGWLIMMFMIIFGMIIRHFQLLPPDFISIFYTGLSLALMLTGLLFIYQRWINKKKQKV